MKILPSSLLAAMAWGMDTNDDMRRVDDDCGERIGRRLGSVNAFVERSRQDAVCIWWMR